MWMCLYNSFSEYCFTHGKKSFLNDTLSLEISLSRKPEPTVSFETTYVRGYDRYIFRLVFNSAQLKPRTRWALHTLPWRPYANIFKEVCAELKKVTNERRKRYENVR